MPDSRDQKLQDVREGVEKGDIKAVENKLATITDPIDQNIYMRVMGNQIRDSKACAALASCEIVDKDKDGSPDVIKTPKVTIEKTQGPNGQELHATPTGGPGLLDKLSNVGKTVLGVAGEVIESITGSPSPEQLRRGALGSGAAGAAADQIQQRQDATDKIK